MIRACLLAAAALSLFAQKKSVTLESMEELGHIHGGISATWSPDGKSFAYVQDHAMIVYDCAAKTSRQLVDTDALDSAAVKPAPDQPDEWQDRYVHDAAFEWRGDSILYSAGGDLSLIHTATGKWEQLTRTAAVEHNAAFSPD